MSRLAIATFVDEFFTAALFQADDAVAQQALEGKLAPDANIVINGNVLPTDLFKAITSQYRSTTTGRILNITDLNVVPVSETGRAGIVAQLTKYETEEKGSGKKVSATATTIVSVEEKEGEMVVAGIWEAQSNDQ